MTRTSMGNVAVIDTAVEEPLISAGRVILDERSFKQMIALERKRTERSKIGFLLMLVQMGQKPRTVEIDKQVETILSAVQPSIRETDVIGWYKGHVTGAVLFTDLAGEKSAILGSIFARVSTLVQQGPPNEQLGEITVSFHFFPDRWDGDDSGGPGNLALYPDLAAHSEQNQRRLRIKRALDVLGGTLALLASSPAFAAIAIAVKLSSKGPVFLKQERVGQYGRRFVFLKFRSMYANNDSSAHREYMAKLIAGEAQQITVGGKREGVYKLANDKRITPIGKFLRKVSLDELPQLINVVRGDMSLVGPRPPLPYEVDAYQLWHRRRVLQAKPGMTGLWQVKGRSKVKFDDMVRLDLLYALKWSLWLDLKILLWTPAALIKGAY